MRAINITDIDFSELMDLRVDYAFKLFFATGETRRLVSLLNAIFENKRIARVVSDLTVVNPGLEKASVADKLSVLDIRAALDDGTTVCIEMHLYNLLDHKYKTVRSWARAYGEELQTGQEYSEQNRVICISFIDGPVTDALDRPIDKIHSLFLTMERDSHEVLLSESEMHFINMKKFAADCNRAGRKGKKEAAYDMFTRWLMLITEKEIKDKEAVKRICDEEELMDAVKTLTMLSKDKIRRQAYLRRQDELLSYNNMLRKSAEKDAIIAKKDATLADMGTALADKDAALADKDAALAKMGDALADKDALIASLMAQIAKDA